MSVVLKEQPVRSRAPVDSLLCDGCGRLSRDNDAECWRCGHHLSAPISRLGQIYSFTTVRAEPNPFVLALVELSCGRTVMARIIDVNCELRIGLPVEFKPLPSWDAEPGGLYFSPLNVI